MGADTLDDKAPRGKEESEDFPELQEFMEKFGPQKGDPTDTPQIEFTAVHYDMFTLRNPTHKVELEKLQTRLAKGKDCIICKEESFFTKTGDYIVVLKWAEFTKKGAKVNAQAQPGE